MNREEIMKELKTNLEVTSVWMNRIPDKDNPNTHETQVFGIDWESNGGFGRYEIIKDTIINPDIPPYIEGHESYTLRIDSEKIDTPDNKEFLKALLEKVIDSITEVE